MRVLSGWAHALTAAPTWMALRAVIAAGMSLVMIWVLVLSLVTLTDRARYGTEEVVVDSCSLTTCTVERRAGDAATVPVPAQTPELGDTASVVLGSDGLPQRFFGLVDYLVPLVLVLLLVAAFGAIREALGWEEQVASQPGTPDEHHDG